MILFQLRYLYVQSALFPQAYFFNHESPSSRKPPKRSYKIPKLALTVPTAPSWPVISQQPLTFTTRQSIEFEKHLYQIRDRHRAFVFKKSPIVLASAVKKKTHCSLPPKHAGALFTNIAAHYCLINILFLINIIMSVVTRLTSWPFPRSGAPGINLSVTAPSKA